MMPLAPSTSWEREMRCARRSVFSIKHRRPRLPEENHHEAMLEGADGPQLIQVLPTYIRAQVKFPEIDIRQRLASSRATMWLSHRTW
jgi:hypothetical protein